MIRVGEMTDDELMAFLDTRGGVWLVRGGPSVLLGNWGTLRAALAQARELFKGPPELHPVAIVRAPDDSPKISRDQIERLVKQLKTVT
jgi:hypothetical protein